MTAKNMIVQGVFVVEPTERDAFLAGRAETMRISRAEQGCIEYVLAPDPLEENRVVLSERWETRADLEAHIADLTARRAAAAERGDDPGVVPMHSEVIFYEASAVDDLP